MKNIYLKKQHMNSFYIGSLCIVINYLFYSLESSYSALAKNREYKARKA